MEEPCMFTAEQVWGAAVAAHRINGEYLKEDDEWSSESPRVANKQLIKQWLYHNTSPATDDDISQGILCRRHFNGYLLLGIAGNITTFQQQALEISQKETFTNSNLFEFAVIACLPSVEELDTVRKTIDIRPYSKLPGKVGDAVQSVVTVLSCVFNPHYHKYRVTAAISDTIVEFWFKDYIEGTISISAKIKSITADFLTQLNRVKLVTPY